MIKNLIPGSQSVSVQRTTFSIDVLGRYICNTLDEAIESGSFDVVIVGSGMYGAYLAAQLAQEGKATNLRVLVVEAGPFLVSEHVQNLALVGLNVPSDIAPSHDPGVAREHVWGLPWRGADHFPGLAYCVGGKSLYWGGWCPRLTAGDLTLWPQAVANDLEQLYPVLEYETGVEHTSDFIYGELHANLKQRFISAAAHLSTREVLVGTEHGVSDAPLAVQAKPPSSGLFSFDKFSSAPLLATAIRRDVSESASDAARRLFLVPNTRVLNLKTVGSRVVAIEVAEQGVRRTIPLSSRGAVVLSASAIESTRLALTAFPTPQMGRGLMIHIRSDIQVRIKRSALGNFTTTPETSALLVRGLAAGRRYHLQIVSVGSQSGNPEEALFRMVPDIDDLEALLESLDSDWITIVLRGVGETVAEANLPVPREGGSWINLSPYESDEFGMPRAWVQLSTASADHDLFRAMEEAALQLAQDVAGSPSNIQYAYHGAWNSSPPNLDEVKPPWRRGLGTTYHESGTLRMGVDPHTSVTNLDARFHHIDNAYACDQSIFCSVGSANPVLTGLCLARRLAAHLGAVIQ